MENSEQHTEDQAEPELLYHYTSDKGLYGILESNTIWATHFQFLNDLSECREAIKMWRETAAKDTELGKTFETILGVMLSELSEIRTFLVSFSDEDTAKNSADRAAERSAAGDRLSQWRGYSSTRQGYSMGFSKIGLERIVDKTKKTCGMNARLLKCLYNDDEKSSTINEMYRQFRQEYEKRDLEIQESSGDYDKSKEVMGKFLPGTGLDLMNLGAVFKHQSFREENEWRVALSTTDRAPHLDLIEFREADGNRVPFVRIPLGLKEPDCPLKRIVVGPALNKEQSVAHLKIELAKAGLRGVEVVPSKIPYRNW